MLKLMIAIFYNSRENTIEKKEVTLLSLRQFSIVIKYVINYSLPPPAFHPNISPTRGNPMTGNPGPSPAGCYIMWIYIFVPSATPYPFAIHPYCISIRWCRPYNIRSIWPFPHYHPWWTAGTKYYCTGQYHQQIFYYHLHKVYMLFLMLYIHYTNLISFPIWKKNLVAAYL